MRVRSSASRTVGRRCDLTLKCSMNHMESRKFYHNLISTGANQSFEAVIQILSYVRLKMLVFILILSVYILSHAFPCIFPILCTIPVAGTTLHGPPTQNNFNLMQLFSTHVYICVYMYIHSSTHCSMAQ